MNERHLLVAVLAVALLGMPLAPASALAQRTKAEEQAVRTLCDVIRAEQEDGIQATPHWSDACLALGRTRKPEFIEVLAPGLWREDSRFPETNIEHYPALWALAEIGTPALPKVQDEIRRCASDRQAHMLALAVASAYQDTRLAQSYLRALERRITEDGPPSALAGIKRVRQKLAEVQ